MRTIDEILKILQARRDRLKREYDERWEYFQQLTPESDNYVMRDSVLTFTYSKLVEINSLIWEFESREKLRNLPDEDDDAQDA